jgi:hypothetical protein
MNWMKKARQCKDAFSEVHLARRHSDTSVVQLHRLILQENTKLWIMKNNEKRSGYRSIPERAR